MENVHTTHNDRLRAHGEQLLQALEAQAAPETYTEILRAARALIAVKKALDLIHKDVAEVETKAAPPAAKRAPVVVNRQMRRTAEALARKVLKSEDRQLRRTG